MKGATRRWIVLLLASSCTGERAPGNDTTSPEGSPPAGSARPPASSTWDARAGDLFLIRSGAAGAAWLLNPAYGEFQALDTLTAATWDVEGTPISMMDGAYVLGPGTIVAMRYDSTCAGWPTAAIASSAAVGSTWRVAFPEGRVDGMAFDSLPDLAPADSASRVRAGALAASRLPDDTVAAFRGRPFIVRQSSRFQVAPDTSATAFEVVRLVPQEANPLEEKLLIITEEGPDGAATRTAFHQREVGLEEAMPSIEIVAVLRVKATGGLALLVRREQENGFVVEWIERTNRGWIVRWRSALDAC